MARKNTGALLQDLPGVTGVALGGTMLIQPPVGRRYKKIVFLCYAVNYTGGVARTPKVLSSANGTVGTGTIEFDGD